MNRKEFLKKGSLAIIGASMAGRAVNTNEIATTAKKLPLSGKTAFITGAARGIGLAAALRLSAMGMNIALVDIADASGADMAIAGYRLSGQADLDNALKAVKTSGANAIAIKADVRRLEEMERAAAATAKTFGNIDVVVANAGIVAWSSLEEASEKQWKDVIDVNITGVMNTVWATLPYVKTSTNGRIITLSSIGGRMGVTGNGAYSATKWAVIGLTKSLALELGKYNITVNAVAPTAVNTPMYRSTGQLASTRLESFTAQDNAMLGYHALSTPALEPKDIADTIGFLASAEAKYISGTVIDVAAGGNAHYTG